MVEWKVQTAGHIDGAPVEAAPDVATGVTDLLRAAAYTAVQKPIDGTYQWINHLSGSQYYAPVVVDAPERHNAWTFTGEMLGNIADYYAASKLVGMGRQQFLGRATAVPIWEAGATGALYELAMPVNDSDFARSKFNNSLLGFGTFGAMDGTASALRSSRWIANSERRFLTKVGVNGVSGATGGVVHGFMDAGLNDKPVNYYEIAGDAAKFGMFSMGLGALDHGVNRSYDAGRAYVTNRINNGEPIFSLGPVEIHPKGFAERARFAAFEDRLTGMYNKAGGAEKLETEVLRAQRSQEPLSITYLDLDNFKAVNDTFGHRAGDEVLREVAEFTRDHYKRGTDIHIREGGDEFMVISPDTNLEHATGLAGDFEQNMRLAVSTDGIRRLQPGEQAQPSEVVVGASTGVVQWQPGESVEQFKGRADELMFQKKELRKQMGLRHDRYAEPSPPTVPSGPDEEIS